ncbi:hypothetical protein [Verticiella alkaliphila]|nr:hypothetical protein [Verticiella sp. GG226]
MNPSFSGALSNRLAGDDALTCATATDDASLQSAPVFCWMR